MQRISRTIRSFLTAALIATATVASPLTITEAHAQSGDGYNRSVRLTNYTNKTVYHVYASNVGTEDWQADLLGRTAVILPDESVVGTIDDGTGYCRYDFKVVFEDGSKSYAMGVNVCSQYQIDITS